MTPEALAAQFVTSVVDEKATSYREIFHASGPVVDPYYQRAKGLFASLTAEQRTIFFEILQQVSVDAASTVLCILDGSSGWAGAEELTFLSEDGSPLHDLQFHFLAAVEARLRRSDAS
jgi:hypothetical protein